MQTGDGARTGSIAAYAKDGIRLELPDNTPAVGNSGGQGQERAQPRKERNVVERADLNETQPEARRGYKAAFHAARCANKENIRLVARYKLMRYCERGNDMAAGSTSGNQNA